MAVWQRAASAPAAIRGAVIACTTLLVVMAITLPLCCTTREALFIRQSATWAAMRPQQQEAPQHEVPPPSGAASAGWALFHAESGTFRFSTEPPPENSECLGSCLSPV